MTNDTFALTPGELASFQANGFVGPFDLYDPDDAPLRWAQAKIEMVMSANKPHQSTVINYDRHLDCAVLSEHIGRPEIVHRLRSLMGDDVICWKTNIFKKDPGDAGTGWHQVETFVVGETTTAGQPSLRYTETTPHVTQELTVWTAFSPADRDHGCLTFIPGSHKRWHYDETRPLSFQPERKTSDFFGYDYSELKLDPGWDPDASDWVAMDMEPGQFVIFVAKCVHGSLPNTSDQVRLGFASRYVAPSVRVYDGVDRLTEFGDSISLDYHGSVLVSGEDDHGHNRLLEANFNGVPFAPPVPRRQRRATPVGEV